MKFKFRTILSLFLSLAILLCSNNIDISANEISTSDLIQGTTQETVIDDTVNASSISLPNIVTVVVKKINQNKVNVFFSNLGIDTVDSVTATLVIVQPTGIVVTRTYRVTSLNPLFNQSFSYYCANWISAQVVDAVAVDGGESGTIGNSPIIYND